MCLPRGDYSVCWFVGSNRRIISLNSNEYKGDNPYSFRGNKLIQSRSMETLLRLSPTRFIWILALVFSSFACVTLTGRPTRSSNDPGTAANGLIAYLGTDGNLYTVDETGTHVTSITQNAHPQTPGGPVQLYQHPTWAQDGRHLAFVAFEFTGSEPTSRLLVADPYTAEITEIFAHQEETPFYLYWSPDNETVSFLTSSPAASELSLRLAFLNGEASRVADTGQPYYWVWSPNGDEIFVHKGGAQGTNPAARLARFFSADGQTQAFDLGPGRFQAPGWSPDGEQFLAALENSLVILNREGEIAQTVTEYDVSISFTWSPNGEQIAYLPTTPASGGFLGPLTIHATRPENADLSFTTPEQTVLAYFWAPDSQKIAYFIADTSDDVDAGLVQTSPISTQRQETFRLALHLMDAQTGATQRLTTFQPTDAFLAIFPFFDQYHHSATLWSPDSEKLVYTAMSGTGEAGVWVIPAAGGAPIQIADGTLAFWSWK